MFYNNLAERNAAIIERSDDNQSSSLQEFMEEQTSLHGVAYSSIAGVTITNSNSWINKVNNAISGKGEQDRINAVVVFNKPDGSKGVTEFLMSRATLVELGKLTCSALRVAKLNAGHRLAFVACINNEVRMNSFNVLPYETEDGTEAFALVHKNAGELLTEDKVMEDLTSMKDLMSNVFGNTVPPAKPSNRITAADIFGTVGNPVPPKPVPPKPSPRKRMTAKAGGISYQQYIDAGWNDEQLVSEGYMVG